jgi:DNA-directed RNA polymerase specialized sigma24 family protein
MATSPAEDDPRELRLLEAAQSGDGDAFGLLVEPYRRELHAHSYRMLASVHDADDALQETLLRAWRGLPRFEGRSSLRTWLYSIATNACLRIAERRSKRMLPLDLVAPATLGEVPGRPLTESVWIEPYPDEWLGRALRLEPSSAKPSSSPSSRRSTTCSRCSEPCSCCARCSASRRSRPRRCSRRASPA